MRNLVAYPVTLDEIIECLKTFKAGCDPELVGDMRPLLLDHAIAAVQYRQLKLWERDPVDG
jgi:hypothetical protein